MDLLRRAVGSRACFSIEFSISPDLNAPTRQWWGTLCLWVDDVCVGNPNEMEMVSIGLGSLVNAAQQTGSRVNLALSSQSATEALESVMQAVYGEKELKWLPHDEAIKLEILPATAGPCFDNWEAILLEEEQTERFIYRRMNNPISEARWPAGTFKTIVLAAEGS